MRQNSTFLFILYLLVMAGVSAAQESRDEFPLLAGPSLKLSGYTQLSYTHWEGDIDGFRIRRARIGLKGDILKNISYRLQVDTIKSPVLLDAAVGINLSPQAKLQFGQFKVPFSIENLTSSSALDTINRSQTVEKLCPGRDIGSQGRDIGFTINGQFSRIEYTAGVFNGSGINRTDSNEQKDMAGRLLFHPVSFITFGLSGYSGKFSAVSGGPAIDRDRTGLEMSFAQKGLSLKGEYILGKDGQVESCGWYVQGGYSFIPGKAQGIIRYDSYDHDTEISGEMSEVITLGFNLFFSKETKFQVNYEYHQDRSAPTSKNVFLVQFQAGF